MTMQNAIASDALVYLPVDPASQFRRDLVALIPHLRAFSRALCGGRAIAEDMAQETLAKAWRAQNAFDPGTNLKAWLFTILRHEVYSHSRRAWREIRWDPIKGERIVGPKNEQDWALRLSDTVRALRELPELQREALILVAASGLSYNEAAGICGVPAGTIKSRVARGRVALLKALDCGQSTVVSFAAFDKVIPESMSTKGEAPMLSDEHASATLA
jgi:RNA polymerase sigma factor (sigma-70 family)